MIDRVVEDKCFNCARGGRRFRQPAHHLVHVAAQICESEG
jgi:hypothetical protein